MKEVEVTPGDKVEIKTKETTWKGNIIESYEYEITLLKLESGYNIGVRNSEIIDVKVLEKDKEIQQKHVKRTAKKELKNVALIITGGTISSKLDPKTGGVNATTVDDLLHIAPELENICNITTIETPFMKGSPHMSLTYWKKIAETAHKLLVDDNVDGIIVTHGTDTLHYGASALSFFIEDLNKPIAFTYSQRSIDRASTDAHLNVMCAAHYATSDIAEVAIIGHKDLHDNVCVALPGTKTRKMHTSRRDAFKAINDTPIATITKDTISIHKTFNARNNAQKPKLDTKHANNVALIKVYPGQSPDILEYYDKKGYKGIVLEVLGLGHVPGKESVHNWLPTIKKLIKKGMIICAVPQTLYGALNPNVYGYGRDLQKTGIIHLKDMLPETAFIKLSWILGHKAWVYNDKSVTERMLNNYAGEFNDTLQFDE